MICEILGLFINTLSVNDKYSLCYSEYFQESIQMQLLKKQKIIFQFFVSFLKSPANFGFFEKKIDPHSLPNVDITYCQRSG